MGTASGGATAPECAGGACGFTDSALVGIVFTEKEIVAGACNAIERGHDVDDASYKLTLRNVPLSSFWLRPRTNCDVIPRKKRCKNASLTAPFVPIFIYCLRKLISISGGELFFCLYITDK
jgi:hypothetical protein